MFAMVLIDHHNMSDTYSREETCQILIQGKRNYTTEERLD